MSIFFAWATEGEAFTPERHRKVELDIFTLHLTQKEWELAILTLEVASFELPPAEKRYAYISVEDSDIRPLFFGKLVHFPIQSHNGLYKLEFHNYVEDFEGQVKGFFNTLKKEPYWCERFINEHDLHNPTSLLEARPDLFVWDRVNGKGTLSNLFKGRKTKELSDSIFHNTLKVSLKEIPLASVIVHVVAEWIQTAGGEVNVGKKIGSRFKKGLINTLSPRQFEASWFKQGRLGQSGYWVVENKLSAIHPQRAGILNEYPSFSPSYKNGDKKEVRLRRQWYKCDVLLRWLYEQQRRQVAIFTVDHNVQLKDHRHQKKLVLRVQGLNPLPTASYFHTQEGIKALEYALRVAWAYLGCSARCVEAEMVVPFEEGRDITLDHTLLIKDKTIPGGVLEGKVTAYKMVITPHERYVKIWVAASVGEDAIDAVPSSQKDFYVEEGYRDKERGSVFESFEEQVPTEGILYPQNLSVHDLIKDITIQGHGDEQESYLDKNQYPLRQNLKAALKEVPTTVHLELLDLSAQPCLEHFLSLKVKGAWSPPKQVHITKRWFS